MKRIRGLKRISLVLLILLGGYFGFQQVRDSRREKTALEAQREVLEQIAVTKQTVPETEQTKPETTRIEAPAAKQTADLKIPFTPQAPFAVWDEIHEDTCEEASVLMAAYFRKGKSLDPQTAENELQALVRWQQERFGYWKDTTAEETAIIAREYYGLNARVVYDFTIAQVKAELTKAKPVLMPAAGQELGNPFYKQPGPPYHMLVLRGYDSQFIYTNDPGTKRGENYKYYPEIILNAAADWPGSDEKILNERPHRRAMVVIE